MMAEPNFANRTLYHGDNLRFLRSINTESVHLIATDPPFNKGKDFHATPDSLAAGAKFQDRWSWEADVEGEWVDQIADDWPKVMTVINAARASYGDDIGAFLCFMGVRLLEMRRVLKSTGSIYLHCDPTASHYLKQLMDAVFGKRNFRNEVVWCYNVGGKSASRWASKHDVLLFYTKTDKYVFDDKAAGSPSDTGTKSFGGKIGIDEDGRRYQDKLVKSTGKYYRHYLDGPKIPEDWWTDINSLQSGVKERTGYPTQKPIALYKRIIKASSNEGDVVLDPFCGCATTLIAAEQCGRQWVGIDIWDKAHKTVIERLQKEGLAGPDGSTDRLLTFGQVHYETALPTRTDLGEEAVPFLQVTEKYQEPQGQRMSRAEMYAYLLAQHGQRCQGCNRRFDDPRYLQLDHNTPRADGGWNHITNRVLLCGPCNQLKSHRYTLSGLQEQNRKLGYMAR